MPDIPIDPRRVPIRLFEGDLEKLRSLYPKDLGYTAVIRALVHQHLRKVEERISTSETAANVGQPNLSALGIATSERDDGGPT